MSNQVTIDFHPSYHSKFFGIDYGKLYHENPFYRLEQDHKKAKGLYHKFNEFGLGNEKPAATSISIGIQPLDFMNGALGGRMVYKHEESVWTPDRPLDHIESMEDLEVMDDINWSINPLYLDYWKQIDELKERCYEATFNGFQGVSNLGDSCDFVMHTPYTTAFRLLGDRIFELMILEEELAKGVFHYLMRQYENLWSDICKRSGWENTIKGNIHFGDCAATMLSPNLYEKLNLPLYQKTMEDYKSCTIHSCGPSSHLLNLFAEIPRVKVVQLGAGTDLKLARKLFPKAHILAYFISSELLSESPTFIENKLWDMAEVLEDNFQIMGSSVDPETPVENVKCFLETAQAISKG